MLEWIQLILRGNIVYKIVIIKIMKNCFHGDYFKSYLPTKPAILLFFQNFRVGLHALEILATSLILGYTMIAHSV